MSLLNISRAMGPILLLAGLRAARMNLMHLAPCVWDGFWDEFFSCWAALASIRLSAAMRSMGGPWRVARVACDKQ
eukprot:1646603-Alexandrium_andersonii.AAC.1